jgi:CHAT domain-containing protein
MILDPESWMNIQRFRALRAAGVSIAEIARTTGHDWATVKKYLTADGRAGPPSRAGTQPLAVAPFTGVVDTWLRRDLTLKATVIHERLVAEHGFTGHYQRVKVYVAKARPAVTEVIEILRRELLGPLAGRLANLGVAAATVVPVGRLSLLPLPAAAPEGCTIALAPSARALRAASRALQERTKNTPALLAVGNPLPVPAGCEPLRYAGLEVRVIEQFFAAGSRQITPERDATVKAVARGLPGATHLHLACHGGFNPEEPLDSALYLSGGDRLTLRDLLDGTLDLSSQRLAVLSACQTGITEYNRVPDEAIGLPAGFLQAGVPGVVATLWPVNDRSTAVLVAEFYRLLLAEQQDPATALTSAREHLRDATARKLAEWFERRYEDSGGTDLTAYESAADFRSHPRPGGPALRPSDVLGRIRILRPVARGQLRGGLVTERHQRGSSRVLCGGRPTAAASGVPGSL